MAEGFRPIIIAILVAGLFALLMISGGIMLQSQNDFSGNIGDDPSLSEYKNSLEGNLSLAVSSTQGADSVLNASSITTTTTNPFIDSIGGIWKGLRTAPVAIWNVSLGFLLEKLFGDNKTIILNILGVIFGITLIFAVIYLIATGDSK